MTAAAGAGTATLVLHGGAVRVAATEPIDAAATAIAFADGRVLAVGADSDLLALAAPDARIVPLDGAVVVPGLVDGHTHPLWGATVTRGVDLGACVTTESLQQTLRTAAVNLADGEWLQGWNLDYAAFEGAPMHRDTIDEAVGGHPAFLMCFDLHTALASTAALAAAGIAGAVAFEDASSVVVDADGQPTGELREPSAYGLVQDAAPTLTQDELLQHLVATLDRFALAGLTGGMVMDGGPDLLDLLQAVEASGELPVRLDVFLWHRPADDDEAVAERIRMLDRHGRRWRVVGIKLFSDGVIDTGTAWLTVADAEGEGLEGYWPDWARYGEVVRRYHAAGLAITAHACGDGGVRAVLDVYETLQAGAAGAPAPRIEHLEVLEQADVARVAALGVTASMQPLHMQWRHGDGSDSWSTRLGERTQHAFPAASLLEAGALVVLGSDWPVASFDPRIGWDWATRRAGGEGYVFEPSERLSPAAALDGLTAAAARSLGAVDRGTLRVGALGDATICAVDPVDAGRLEPLGTVVAGAVVAGSVVAAGAEADGAQTGQ